MPIGYLAIKLLTSKVVLMTIAVIGVALGVGLVEAADFLQYLPDVSLDPTDYLGPEVFGFEL